MRSGDENSRAVTELRALFLDGSLTRDAFESGLRKLGVEREWRRWADRLLAALGTGLVLAGIVFFIAFHWIEFDDVVKLAGAQALVVIAAGVAWWRGIDTVIGRVSAFAASFLVGVYLAAFGQVYQTGADVFEMFAAWAALITIWVFVVRTPEQWLLWVALIDGAIALWFDHVAFYDWQREFWAWSTLALVQFGVLAGLEIARRRGWLGHRYPIERWVLVPVGLFQLCVPIMTIFASTRFDRDGAWFVLLLAVVVGVAGVRFYRFVVCDLFAILSLGLAGIWCLVAVLWPIFGDEECAGLLVLGFVVVASLAWLVQRVRLLALDREGGAGD